MKIAPHIEGQRVDEYGRRIIAIARKNILDEKKKDDAVYLVCGPTGTGKSNLTLNFVEEYTPNPDPALVTLGIEKFASSMQYGLSLPKGERYLDFDEADVGRREGMSKWNRAVIKIYYKIREEGFLHFWNHPSINNIDREFIKERVNGLFLTYDKATNRPRRYYFFPKERLLDFLDKFGVLNTRMLLKNAPQYALYRGSYTAYNGPLLAAYKQQKKEGMREAIAEFADAWGGDGAKWLSMEAAAKKLGINSLTTKKAVLELMDQGAIRREEVVNAAGRWRLREEHLEIIGEHRRKKTEQYRMERGYAI